VKFKRSILELVKVVGRDADGSLDHLRLFEFAVLESPMSFQSETRMLS
jgi:hypothetical protein